MDSMIDVSALGCSMPEAIALYNLTGNSLTMPENHYIQLQQEVRSG